MQVKFLAYLQQICFCLVSGSHMTSTVPNILHGLLPQNSVDTLQKQFLPECIFACQDNWCLCKPSNMTCSTVHGPVWWAPTVEHLFCCSTAGAADSLHFSAPFQSLLFSCLFVCFQSVTLLALPSLSFCLFLSLFLSPCLTVLSEPHFFQN